MSRMTYYFPGAILIFLAILIVAFPEILVAIIAAAILLTGLGVLYAGHVMSKSKPEFNQKDDCSGDDAFVRRDVGWRPIYKRWHRWF